MTVWSASMNSSIRVATAPWGRARNTASASSGTWSNTWRPRRREVRVDVRDRVAVALAAHEAGDRRRCGWRARSRISSAPTYPVAPTIATRTGSPSRARAPRSAAVGVTGSEVTHGPPRSPRPSSPRSPARVAARGRQARGSRRSGGTWSRGMTIHSDCILMQRQRSRRPRRPPRAAAPRPRTARGTAARRARRARCSSRCVPRSTIRPFSKTRIRSARRIVESRWAIAIVVRPSVSRASAAWISRSDTVSSDEVASSRIRIRGSLSSTRAIAIRCFSPPESL